MPVNERTTSLQNCHSTSTVSSGLSESSCFSDRQHNLNKSMYELLHSEHVYIFYLQDLLDITTGAVHENIQMMMNLHCKFLRSLQEALSNTTLVKRLSEVHDRVHSSHFDFNSLIACDEIDEVEISQVLKTFIPFLKIYTQYIKEYYPLLSQQKEQHQLYIMPIQRMMRYNLLISAISQFSLPVYKEPLEACLVEIQAVVNGINQSVHDAEALQQLVYYQKHTSHLADPLLQPHQQLKMQSTIYRISNISKDKRIILVLQDKVVWLKQVAPSKYSFRGQLRYPIKCQVGETVQDGPAKGHCPILLSCPVKQITTFHKVCGSIAQYTFYGETESQIEQLCKVINSATSTYEEYVYAK